MAICTNTSPNIVLPFTVYECSSFSDRCRPDWEQMEKLAINIQPVRVSSKTSGFSVAVAPRPVAESDDEDDLDEVARGN